MERELSAPAERRRWVGAVRTVLHPFEFAVAWTGVKSERGILASIPELAATGHKVVGRRGRRRWRRGAAGHGECGRRCLSCNHCDHHRVRTRHLTVFWQPRQRDLMVARLETGEDD